MIPYLISRGLGLGPVRRLILCAGRGPLAVPIFRHLSGAARVFASADEARRAISRYRPETAGHADSRLIGSNFSLSSSVRMSDYPVLFWLGEAAREEKLIVFDFGGGVGQTFVNYAKRLSSTSLERWIVNDLPEVVREAPSRFFSRGLPPNLEFTDEMKTGEGSNVVIAAGSFHYWEGSVRKFFDHLGSHPKHFIINRSPMRDGGEGFYTVQQGHDWAVACKVRSVAALQSEMEQEGYSLVDGWIDPDKTLTLPFFPEYSCRYRGLYFQRNRVAVEGDERSTAEAAARSRATSFQGS